MTLGPGTRIGPYEVRSWIASGGMGEVYRAHDPRLGRDVAVKVLPEALAADERRLRRLEREARAASALNHPNIVTVHDIGRSGAAVFVAMELVEGETLRQVFAGGPLDHERLLTIAGQIAAALAAAHEAGIVHRDLKPENVMVRPDGYVKLLDFGLAKIAPAEAVSSAPTADLLTRPGAVMGTAAYMSPEQSSGGVVDHRTDQYAFGVMLCEMLTGRRPLGLAPASRGDAAVSDRELESLDLPDRFRPLLERCLARDPARRYAATADLVLELRALDRRPRVEESAGGGDRSTLRSLVVLPLANMSADPEQEYFSDGMTEALITDLAKIRAFRLISRTTAMRYKGSTKALPQIARELGVDAVVEGSVMRAGDRVRITAQLIDARQDTHLWAESYERDHADILALQAEVARAIAYEVEVRLSSGEEERLRGRRSVDPRSHEALLKGRYYFRKYSPEFAAQALELLERAVELDPGSALAQAALADACGQQAYWGFSRPAEFAPRARRSARRAVALDGTLATAHGTLGAVELYLDWDWASGSQHLERALELDPTDADAVLNYAFYLAMRGRAEEGIHLLQGARELDPLNHATVSASGWLSNVLGRPERAVEACRFALEIEKDSPLPHLPLWGAYELLGRMEEALASCESYFRLAGRPQVAEAARRGFDQGGYASAMRCAAEELERLGESQYVQAIDVAKLHAHGGDPARTLEWLERAFREGEPRIHTIPFAREFDLVRPEPRFAAVLEGMGLDPTVRAPVA